MVVSAVFRGGGGGGGGFAPPYISYTIELDTPNSAPY